MVTVILFTVIFMIPIYGLLLWAFLFGSRRKYKEEPEKSRTAIRYIKLATITSMVVIPIVLLSFILKIYVLLLALVIFPIVFIFEFLR